MIKKSKAKHNWLKYGLNPEDFEKAWFEYCNSTNCDWCKRGYKSERDKQMDHCHDEGHFRNILCKTCNMWRHQGNNINKYWHKQRNKYIYEIKVVRNKNYILNKSRSTLEEAEQILLEFKKNNGFYFPFFTQTEI
tara:strand:+ start:42 stop:446 length:405 start_codon:yes stop_codon:yes gene_type:complete